MSGRAQLKAARHRKSDCLGPQLWTVKPMNINVVKCSSLQNVKQQKIQNMVIRKLKD